MKFKKSLGISVLAAALLAPVVGYANTYMCPDASQVNALAASNNGHVSIQMPYGTLTGTLNAGLAASNAYTFHDAAIPIEMVSGQTMILNCSYFSGKEPYPIPLSANNVTKPYQGVGAGWTTTDPYAICSADTKNISDCTFEDKTTSVK